jgi:hypothetical protein
MPEMFRGEAGKQFHVKVKAGNRDAFSSCTNEIANQASGRQV